MTQPAQFALAPCLLLDGALTAQLSTVIHHPTTARWLWLIVALTLGLVAFLGILAVCIVQIEMWVISPVVMSTYDGPRRARLASDYALNSRDCNRAIGTLITIFREALLYLTLGLGGEAILWILLHRL